MTRRVAFFRGMNVGGHNIVPMAELRATFTSLGFERVESLIQSGNVFFTPDDAADAQIITAAILDAISERFGVTVPVTLRTHRELATALAAHPFPPGKVEPKFHHIMFLADTPPADAQELLAGRSPVDDFAVVDCDVHVRYNQGSARSKFTVDWVDRRLQTVATARNLTTCERVVALLAE